MTVIINNYSKLNNSKATKLISYVFNDLDDLEEKEWETYEGDCNVKEIYLDYWYDGFHLSILVRKHVHKFVFEINNSK